MTDTEIWLYGSTARGDRDEASDVDVLIAGDEASDLESLDLPIDGPISVSRYGWAEIEHMADYGSLFLHHLKLEGKPIQEQPEQRMRKLLGALGEYRRAGQELASFERVLEDVEESLDGDHSPAYELAVVATAARHAVILGCYLLDQPNFGRVSAFKALLPRLGYSPGEVEDFIELYRFRRAEDWERPLRDPRFDENVGDWVEQVRVLIKKVGDLRNG